MSSTALQRRSHVGDSPALKMLSLSMKWTRSATNYGNVNKYLNEEIFIQAFNIGVCNYREVLSLIEDGNMDFGIGAKNGFREIVQRHDSRYEVPYKMSEIVAKTNILDLVSPFAYRILGADAHVVNCSLVVSKPGSQV